jgi:tetratricopeptide (TPR) repeat protein
VSPSFLVATLVVVAAPSASPASPSAAALPQGTSVETRPTEARILHLLALDRLAEFDADSALALFDAARSADPTSLPIHLRRIVAMIHLRPRAQQQLRREYEAMPDSPLVECLRAWLAVADDNRAAAAETLFELERRYPDESCPVVLLSRVLRDLRPRRVWEPRQFEYLERAAALEPDWIDARVYYAEALASAGRLRDSEQAFADAAARLTHPVHVLPLMMRRAGVLRQLGDIDGAEAVRRTVHDAVQRDGRPGLKYTYLYELDSFSTVQATVLGSQDAAVREQGELAARHGSPPDEWQARYTLGLRLTNRGEPLAAIEQLDRAVMIADSAGFAHREVRTLYKRAAALVRAGRRQEAEADLLHAVELIPLADSPYTEAETWHGLLHLCDDDGRLDEALLASERFIGVAEQMPHSPLRMSAWLDAGELRWKAGQHAAAEEAYGRLVRVVDDYDEFHAYAGQHFERTGDLPAALEYFRRGALSEAASADGIRALSWAGLVRVHRALGALDSAEVAARRHDAAITHHASVPMLPTLLAEGGRVDESLETAEAWARRRIEAGAVEGAAAAHILWAGLLLEAGEPAEALEVADRADSLARSIDRVGLSADANRLRGLALESLGESVAALAALETAADAALRHGDAGGVIDTQVALGEALTRRGKTLAALRAFDTAASHVEGVTQHLDVDYDRVRFREQRMAPYDGALLALLAAQGGAAPGELLTWSARRKAAALRLTLGRRDGGVGVPVVGAELSVPHLQLDEREVLLDYNIVDEFVFVLVVSPPAGIEVVRLEIPADSVRWLADRLRKPFTAVYAGSIDLARFRFPETAARELYQAIVAPVLPAIHGAERLLIAPDGPLHRISFAALVSDDVHGETEPAVSGEQGIRYLLDEFEITYVPSAGAAGDSDRSGWKSVDTSRSAAVVVGDAPGTRKEVDHLSAVWPGEVIGADVDETTESAFSALAFRPAVLHVASHAIADDRDPLASHIRLAPDSLADGLLHGAEISAMDLSGTLVVLSACETLEGPLYAGEGLLGLQRSFQATGTSAVLATLWPVGASAAELVEHFYQGLVRGEPPATALREAQLDMLANPATAHPFHWAGFVLHGGI